MMNRRRMRSAQAAATTIKKATTTNDRLTSSSFSFSASSTDSQQREGKLANPAPKEQEQQSLRGGSGGAGGGNTPRVEKSPVSHRIPVKHSLNLPPPVCTHLTQLLELTQEVLESKPGSLFAYRNGFDTAQDAWKAAETTRQKVEFLVRGHAWTVQGTQWNRWTRTSEREKQLLQEITEQQSDGDDATANNNNYSALQSMQALIDRVYQEGEMYMMVRASRLEELARLASKEEQQPAPQDNSNNKNRNTGVGDSVVTQDTQDNTTGDTNSSAGSDQIKASFEGLLESGTASSSEFDLLLEGGANVDGDDDGDIMVTNEGEMEQQQNQHKHPFAIPGPTVAMWDAVLDTMACCQSKSPKGHYTAALQIMHEILKRHELSGDDEHNTNPHTLPTAVSFNAPIRIAAQSAFDPDNKKPANIRLRDQAIQLAFEGFDAITCSSVVERNSATYAYLLQTMSKFFPASRSRGNICHGMFHHASEQGLIDQTVVTAHLAANVPSNGPEFEEWISKTLKDVAIKDLPLKWRRRNRITRHRAKEAIY